MFNNLTKRERVILFVGMVLGAVLVVSTHIAKADASIEDRPLRYQNSDFHDPMMPPGFKFSTNPEESPSSSINLSSWDIEGVIVNDASKLIYIDGELLREGDVYDGYVISKITLKKLHVIGASGTGGTWRIKPAISRAADRGFKGAQEAPLKHQRTTSNMGKRLLDDNTISVE